MRLHLTGNQGISMDFALPGSRRRFSLGLGGPHGRTWGALESNGFVWKFKGKPSHPVAYLFMFPKINGIFFGAYHCIPHCQRNPNGLENRVSAYNWKKYVYPIFGQIWLGARNNPHGSCIVDVVGCNVMDLANWVKTSKTWGPDPCWILGLCLHFMLVCLFF